MGFKGENYNIARQRTTAQNERGDRDSGMVRRKGSELNLLKVKIKMLKKECINESHFTSKE